MHLSRRQRPHVSAYSHCGQVMAAFGGSAFIPLRALIMLDDVLTWHKYALFYSAAAPACRTKSLATASSARSFVTRMFLALATGPRREAGAVKIKSICNKHRLGSQDVHGHHIWGVPVVSSLNIVNPINPVLIICNMRWTRNASRSSL